MGQDMPPPLPPSPAEPLPGSTPWERRDSLGVVPALFETTKQVLLSPAEFFRQMPVSGGIGAPLGYAVIVGYLGVVVQALYQAVLNIGLGSAFAGFGDRSPFGRLAPMMQGGLGLGLQLVMGPILVVVGTFIVAGIYHLMLMLLGQAKRDFEATLRVVCYGQAASIVLVVPFCGGIVSAVWRVVLGIVGLAEAHRIGHGSAAIAVLAPIVLICCCCGAAAALLFGGLAGALGNLQH